jgi:hypothetical protein
MIEPPYQVAHMIPELTVYMLPNHHGALNTSLYGDEYGSGERTLNLEMVSANTTSTSNCH